MVAVAAGYIQLWEERSSVRKKEKKERRWKE